MIEQNHPSARIDEQDCAADREYLGCFFDPRDGRIFMGALASDAETVNKGQQAESKKITLQPI